MSVEIDAFPSFHKIIQYKSNDKANHFLEMSEQSFEKNAMLESLIFINKAISFSNSMYMLSICYANRSAIYFKLEKYDECLKSILLARENNFAENIIKLDEREKKCKKLLKTQPDKTKVLLEHLKLSYPANEKVPWIVDCIELKKSSGNDRGIYTKRNLKAGDILSVEEPMICLLRDDAFYKHCFNCLKTCMLNLIPCVRTASMMFCSVNCMEKTYSKTYDMNTILFDDLKILTEIIDSFDSNNELDDFMARENLNQLDSTIFDYDFNDQNDPKYCKNLVKCLLSLPLTNNQPIQINNSTIQNSVSKKNADHILNLLLYKNVTHFFIGLKNLDWYNDAGSIPLFAGLINYSCAPNVQPIFVDNKIVICVSKPIKSGEQLFCTYVNGTAPQNELMKRLVMMHYNLKCDCSTDQISQFNSTKDDMPQINKNELLKFKEYLIEGWKNINLSKSKEEIEKYKVQNFLIMELIAYYCSFPC